MFVCRLFHRDRPFEQIEARILPLGQITLGRDPNADWPLPDPEGTLSRIHCHLNVEPSEILLCDVSTNGTFIDGEQRAPAQSPIALQVGQTLRLGSLIVLIDQIQAADAQEMDATAAPGARTRGAEPLRARPDRTEARASVTEASLLDAFCEGAQLDVSALSAEDPAELMRRIGAIYQETVLGLGALMEDRARLKGQHNLDRTTISPAKNNPFKWAPTRRVAQDLLSSADPSFLGDAEAVRASFQDLARHVAAVGFAASAATQHVLEALSPAAIEQEARSVVSLRGRAATSWEIFSRRHQALAGAQPGQADAVGQAFVEAYGRSIKASEQ